MKNEQNPIDASVKWLVECGYTNDQARNLVSAIKDKSKDRLWELAPKWIEHVGEHKKYQEFLDTVALGIIEVTADENGEWCMALNEDGLKIGKEMFGDE